MDGSGSYVLIICAGKLCDLVSWTLKGAHMSLQFYMLHARCAVMVAMQVLRSYIL